MSVQTASTSASSISTNYYYNSQYNTDSYGRVLPRVYCDCAGCRDDICEMAIGVTYRNPPRKNIENHHCCECKCKYCVCEKRRNSNKYMRMPIVPNKENHCGAECEMCMKGLTTYLENKSKYPVQNCALYPYLLESYENRFTDKTTGKLNTKALCEHVNKLEKRLWFSFEAKTD